MTDGWGPRTLSDERLCVSCPVLRPHGQPRYVEHPNVCEEGITE